MTIEIEKEQLLPLAQAAGHLPNRRGGKKKHVSTLHRWATIGIGGIKLETLRCGGVKCTSLPALQRFFERLSANESSTGGTPTVPNTAVEAELDAEWSGIRQTTVKKL